MVRYKQAAIFHSMVAGVYIWILVTNLTHFQNKIMSALIEDGLGMISEHPYLYGPVVYTAKVFLLDCWKSKVDSVTSVEFSGVIDRRGTDNFKYVQKKFDDIVGVHVSIGLT
jgi:hypothetical protein